MWRARVAAAVGVIALGAGAFAAGGQLPLTTQKASGQTVTPAYEGRGMLRSMTCLSIADECWSGSGEGELLAARP